MPVWSRMHILSYIISLRVVHLFKTYPTYLFPCGTQASCHCGHAIRYHQPISFPVEPGLAGAGFHENLLLGCTVTLCGTRVRQFCFWELLVRQPMVSTWSSRKRFCAASTAAYRCVDTATFFFSATSVSPLPYCDLRGLVEATRDCVQGLQRVNWLQRASASAR